MSTWIRKTQTRSSEMGKRISRQFYKIKNQEDFAKLVLIFLSAGIILGFVLGGLI